MHTSWIPKSKKDAYSGAGHVMEAYKVGDLEDMVHVVVTIYRLPGCLSAAHCLSLSDVMPYSFAEVSVDFFFNSLWPCHPAPK